MTPASRILIVDDEPNVRLMFRTALAQTGHILSVAEDGESALRAQEAMPSDLILLDLKMPGIDGMEVLRRLRARGDDVSIVIVTAHGSIADAVEAMKLGAIDFVSKPITPEALRGVAADVLSRRDLPQRPATARLESVPVTAESQYAGDLARAKRALNLRHFNEAEVFLKQAVALRGTAEAHNLMGVLHELRNEHDDSYREYKAALKADKHYDPAMHNMTRYYERFTFGRSQVPVDTGEE